MTTSTAKVNSKGLIAGISASVIALVTFIIIAISMSTGMLAEQLTQNSTRITRNEQEIHKLNTEMAVNQEQQKQILEK